MKHFTILMGLCAIFVLSAQSFILAAEEEASKVIILGPKDFKRSAEEPAKVAEKPVTDPARSAEALLATPPPVKDTNVSTTERVPATNIAPPTVTRPVTVSPAVSLPGFSQKAMAIPAQLPVMSASPSRFMEIATKLDMGGDFYLYADIKDYLKAFVSEVKNKVQTPGISPVVVPILVMVDAGIEALGLYSVQDFGASGIQVSPTIHRSKCFLSTPEGQKGLFEVFGPAPHALSTLAYAPANTALFTTHEVDLGKLIDLVKDVAVKTNGPAAAELITGKLQQIGMMLGTPIEPLIKSIKGEITLIVTVDNTKTLSIPMNPQGPPLSVPMLNAALMVRTADAQVFDLLLAQLQARQMPLQVTDLGGIKKMTIALPPNPVYPLVPSLVYDGQYLILSAQASFIDEMLATKQADSGLATTAEFKSLTEGLPITAANSMSFISGQLRDTIKQVVGAAMSANPGVPAGASKMVIPEMVIQSLDKIRPTASIRINDPKGLWWITNINVDTTKGERHYSVGGMAVLAGGALVPAAFAGLFVFGARATTSANVMADPAVTMPEVQPGGGDQTDFGAKPQ